MAKPDEGVKLTERELNALEKRIAAVYRQAAKELDAEVKAYFAGFEVRDAEQKSRLDAGEITEQQYRQWCLNQIARGKRFEALRDKMAQRYTQANETSVAYVNDATPGIYSLNRNYAAYTIEQVSDKADFTLWDERTVRRMIIEQPDSMPYYPLEKAVRRGIDLSYGKRQITASVTSAILQGKSIGQIADDLQQRIQTMNRNSAIRSARTAVTGAQNAGRLDSYAAAEKMGIKLKKQWLATLDGRTRHSHALLDGESVDRDKPFSNGCMFPGDPNGKPEEVYNCRCTLIADLAGIDQTSERRAKDPKTGETVLVRDMTYAQWQAWKESEDKQAWDSMKKKARNAKRDEQQLSEYQKILGNKAPTSLYKFQELKYNKPDEWQTLRILKKQIEFVNDAPCVTTTRKFTGYFLKEGAKHAQEFFDVGYTADNPMQLRYDISKQFDMNKAQDIEILNDGSQKFSMFMDLGMTKQKSFLVCWIKEPGSEKPRIISAYRKGRKKK